MLVLITLKPQFNEADPERYKAGFDGGVDFIATFDVVKPIHRNVCFYIQCKCHKEPLTKTAIRHTNVNRKKNYQESKTDLDRFYLQVKKHISILNIQ